MFLCPNLADVKYTKEGAILALQAEVSQVFDNAHGIKRKKEKISFRAFSELYLQDYAMTVKKSWKTDKSRLKTLVEYLKDADLRDITPLSIQRFIANRQKHGNTRSTINRYLALLKNMFNMAIEEGCLEHNPVSKIKSFSEIDNLKERILTPSEEKKLLETCASHLKSMVIIALNTGMRLGEILGLNWNQVNLQDRNISIEKTKSGRNRLVPINPALYAEFLDLKKRNKEHPYVFFNERTRKPLTSVKTAFKAACRRAGIDNLRFHDLRHTFGSRLIQNGVDVETVRSLLGHSSILITQRYVHSTDERRKVAVETLEEKAPIDAEKGDNLLHICDMEAKRADTESSKKLANPLISWN